MDTNSHANATKKIKIVTSQDNGRYLYFMYMITEIKRKMKPSSFQ